MRARKKKIERVNNKQTLIIIIMIASLKVFMNAFQQNRLATFATDGISMVFVETNSFLFALPL